MNDHKNAVSTLSFIDTFFYRQLANSPMSLITYLAFGIVAHWDFPYEDVATVKSWKDCIWPKFAISPFIVQLTIFASPAHHFQLLALGNLLPILLRQTNWLHAGGEANGLLQFHNGPVMALNAATAGEGVVHEDGANLNMGENKFLKLRANDNWFSDI